jgi:5-methylcytosine-specific restriction endonuclease McrA
LLSEAYQSQIAVASVKQSGVCHGRELIILVQGHESLYNNLQRKDYDNNLVKDNSWKEIAGELHAQDKEFSRTRHCLRMSGYWQGCGRETAWEQHGKGMVCVNRP